MRNDYNDCSGYCTDHGAWSIKVTYLGRDEEVADDCPQCVATWKRRQEVDKAIDEGFALGMDEPRSGE